MEWHLPLLQNPPKFSEETFLGEKKILDFNQLELPMEFSSAGKKCPPSPVTHDDTILHSHPLCNAGHTEQETRLQEENT